MLADRVIVVLGRPGRIRRDDRIELARPRRRATRASRGGASGSSTI